MKKAGRGRSLVFISISGLAMLGAAGFAEAQPLPRLDQSVAPRAPAAVTPGPDCGPDGGPVVRRLPTVPALVTPIDPLIVQRLHAQRAALSSRDDDAADSETSSASPAPTVAAARGKIVSLGSARMALSSVPTATGRAVAAALLAFAETSPLYEEEEPAGPDSPVRLFSRR